MSIDFDASSLERSYAFLDDCPEYLLDEIITLPIGTLTERVRGARLWHDALLLGALPPEDTWPQAGIAAPVRLALAELGLLRFCKDQTELVEILMKEIISAFLRQADAFGSEVTTRLRELEELERCLRVKSEKERKKKRPSLHIEFDDETLRRLCAQAMQEAMQRQPNPDGSMLSTWSERTRAWTEIADVFGDLGEMMGRGWDLSCGVLRHTGWMDLLRLRELIEKLPQLREIVRTLGRLEDPHGGVSVAEKVLIPVRRLEEERREVQTPLIPAEIRGLERSGEITRMLPVEALMLGHPQLRMLWHARRAERALLTYRVQGTEIERVLQEREDQQEIDGRRPRPERGPILAIVDTSGSMHGLPEQVAKAIVLEALRTAHEEKRKCYLYAYSGPGQVLEHELDLSPEGVGRLLKFLGFSFGGGNDEVGVMTQVLARLKEKSWKKADVVFVSDGEWPAPPSLVAAVKCAREDGVRLHGVQIGNRGCTGLHAVCDPVHTFQDWAAAGGWGH
ncbi:hypothetical protein KV708_14600 [Comamonas thiooxydans]|uniref:VWA domain-containing protein n=1 Tax=Comamonas thiooxydans TaxID=363952 RepID=UPI0009C09EF1|nr:VWA domain-containing protein [Comamonas thiooxydans]